VSSAHFLISLDSIGQRKNPVNCGWAESALLEEWRQGVEQRARRDGVAGASVDPEEAALVMIKVDQIEAHSTVAD
jgi:hypothetical protein